MRAAVQQPLIGPGCNSSFRHQFLAAWAPISKIKVDYGGNNVTAIFCEPTYWKQRVSVDVSAATKQLDANSVVPVGSRDPLGAAKFNTTALEYLMGTGVPAATATRDYAASTTIQSWPILQKEQNVAGPVTLMVTYALGLVGAPAAALQNASVLENAFALAHKTVFAIAMSQILSDTGRAEAATAGTVQRTLYGVEVSRPIAAVLEGLLVRVALLAAAVLWTCARAESKLPRDPAAIGFTIAALKRCATLLSRPAVAESDSADSKTLAQGLAGQRFALTGSYPPRLEHLEPQPQDPPMSSGGGAGTGVGLRRSTAYSPFQPRELRPASGIILVSILLCGAGVLVYLKKHEEELHGLPRPTDNFEVLQLLENYIPTVFATLLEPFLVLLTRLLSILQPFHELRMGKRPAEKTLDAKYTSLPPQLVVWRALRSKHFLLGALGSISLLVNALTVALGGTFNELSVAMEYPTAFIESRRTNLSRNAIISEGASWEGYLDHLYAVYSNLSSNTRLRPWVTRDYAFLLINATARVQDGPRPGLFRTKARGFRALPKCAALATSPSTTQPYANLSGINAELSTIPLMFRRDNGTWTQCSLPPPSVRSRAARRSAQELVGSLSKVQMSGGDFEWYNDGFCDDRMVLGWARLDSSSDSDTTTPSSL
ncbi:hypothetical protein B0T26DRAFT_748446 [Lasiosphaeria miniovina]|uniref:Uncharacterized protein n=1 Tax=Lasiosphaeria miniovina TaxID=1954250 RepID=A0AA40B5Q4_9PEZI|nr:uncharacterized protein B0T26DRAFT_748446 [Lasiosphaeria miniovina]KAK0728189.1 hypothetical protein B0T26DRAFT_748446 [Lasiosphaeria miniovina]